MFFNRKCKITFVKHGATINTEENRFFDNENFPAINETGKHEMELISRWIVNRGLKVDKIYTDSALRCVQSARILANTSKQDFEIINGLSGRKSGVWSGLTLEEIENKFPNELEKYYKNAENYTPEKAEPLIDFNNRINKIINEIIEKNINKRLVIVTHGEVIQAAVANATKIPLNDQFKIYIPSGSATQISYFKNWASLIYSAYIPFEA